MSISGFSVAQSTQSEYHLITAINHRAGKALTLCFFSIMYQSAVSLPSGQCENAAQSRHSELCLSGSTSHDVLFWCCVKAAAFFYGVDRVSAVWNEARCNRCPISHTSLPLFPCLFFSKDLRSGFQTRLLITCCTRGFVWHAKVLPYVDSFS